MRRVLELVLIQDIRPGSIADRLGIHPGDTLISVNGQSPKDILDYRFLMSDEEIRLFTRSQDGSLRESIIYKEFDEDIGLEFEDALFDGIRRCHNRCIF
ncbi:MAG TPA: PDZ domain-containing protein, partial [Firmicutes bacterium]|nr:PDZ domain-containing protein [Bacillota bacterium]